MLARRLDWQTAQSRGCGKALLKWHGAEVPASLFLYPHPCESGMLARVLCLDLGTFLIIDFPYHPVVSKCAVQLQLFSLVPRMSKLYILSTCQLGGSEWKEAS